ncbi:unnamed protein product [Oikopleura dioica]|uniref:Uncharacterized protein n=1 Tax=Oikopleura dioica TaxID=34765 RepID=E4Y539_OIKDI|nr:unnamed protein product [Oikopleura dioica]
MGEEESGRLPAREEKEGFRPSLSPTGDVFDDSNNNIAAAIVDGLNEDPTTETEEQETEQAPAEPAVEQTEEKEEENTTKQEEAEEKDDASDDSSATDATVEIKVAPTNQSIPDVVPKGLGEREVSHVDIDDKEKLTKTTDLENEIEEATTPAKFDGVAEPARRNSAVKSSWERRKHKFRSMWKLYSGAFIAVVMPIAVFSIDIAITMNVLDQEGYRKAIQPYWDTDSRSNKPIPEFNKLTNGATYDIADSLLFEVLTLSDQHKNREVDDEIRKNYPEFMKFVNKKADPVKKPPILSYTTKAPPKTSTEEVKSTSDEKEPKTGEEVETNPEEEEVRRRRRQADDDENKEEEAEEDPAKKPTKEGEEAENDTTEEDSEEKTKPKKPDKTEEEKAAAAAAAKARQEEEEKKLIEENRKLEEERKNYLQLRRNLTVNNIIEYKWGNETMYEGKQLHCDTLSMFYHQHELIAKSQNQGWFEYVYGNNHKLQQVLFILFTIFGFILCILSIALRSDMWFKNEWSSFILATFLPYIVSTCLVAIIYMRESGKSGLRCFICRLAFDDPERGCIDIDPTSFSGQFPTPETKWLGMVVACYVLKLFDCISIGLTTLTFVCSKKDAWWKWIIKFLGWVVVFPWMIATPLFGVLRYQVISEVVSMDSIGVYENLLTGLFFTGIGLWGVLIIAGPIFCKYKMCDIDENLLEKDDF